MTRLSTLTLLLSFLLLGLATGCDSDSAAPDSNAVPQPNTVAKDAISLPVDRPPSEGDEADALYYHAFSEPSPTDEALMNDSEKILASLVDDQLALENAWVPILDSRDKACGAPNVRPALVVELEAPDARIYELGFVSAPQEASPPFYPNCGIEMFEEFSFE